jgi:hypothetical protein
VKHLTVNPPYSVYAILPDGKRRRVRAVGVVVELRAGIEVEIDLAPHPRFAGQLILMTPPEARMERVYDEGKLDDFAVAFGASNVLHVLVERRVRPSRSAGAKPKKKASTQRRR